MYWMVRNKILWKKREHNEKLTPGKWVESSLMDNKWLTHENHFDFSSLCHSLFFSFFMLILISSGFWSKWFLFTFGSSLSMCHIKIEQFLSLPFFFILFCLFCCRFASVLTCILSYKLVATVTWLVSKSPLAPTPKLYASTDATD